MNIIFAREIFHPPYIRTGEETVSKSWATPYNFPEFHSRRQSYLRCRTIRSVTIRNFPPPWARWMGKGPGGWKLCAFESFSRITYEIDWKREVSRYLWYTVAWTTTLKKPPLVLFQKKLEFFRSEFTFFNHFSSFCCSLNAIQNILCRWLCREGKWDFEVKGDLEIKRLEVYREYLFRNIAQIVI